MIGSDGNTSSAAPATLPESNASLSAASSTSSPRAQLITRTPSRICANARASSEPRVSGVLGRCSVMKSAWAKTSALVSACSTPSSRKRSAETNGSNATIRIPNARARAATNCPIRPNPSTPSVFSYTSTPPNRDRSHRPAISDECACGTFRASASINAIVCSAAATTFDCGAFATTIPRFVAAGTSTLSTPIPARPITRNRPARPINSASNRVADRIRIP